MICELVACAVSALLSGYQVGHIALGGKPPPVRNGVPCGFCTPSCRPRHQAHSATMDLDTTGLEAQELSVTSSAGYSMQVMLEAENSRIAKLCATAHSTVKDEVDPKSIFSLQPSQRGPPKPIRGSITSVAGLAPINVERTSQQTMFNTRTLTISALFGPYGAYLHQPPTILCHTI